MEARRIDRLLQRHAVIDEIDDDFQHRGDDARTARRSEHENRLAILDTMVGVMELNGRFPGATALASP